MSAKQYVILYLCSAEFTGDSAIAYEKCPEVGSEHECILFVLQTCADYDTAQASHMLAKHGWTNVNFKRVGPFQPESINPQEWAVFQRYYQECLEYGDSLVWYA